MVKEEIVTSAAPQQVTATNLSSHNAAVTVTKNLVPSKIVGLKPSAPSNSVVQSNPIPATLLPKQPHPPSAILHSTQQSKENSSSIIIVKQCQTWFISKPYCCCLRKISRAAYVKVVSFPAAKKPFSPFCCLSIGESMTKKKHIF